jgi:hypothetical protein
MVTVVMQKSQNSSLRRGCLSPILVSQLLFRGLIRVCRQEGAKMSGIPCRQTDIPRHAYITPTFSQFQKVSQQENIVDDKPSFVLFIWNILAMLRETFFGVFWHEHYLAHAPR